MNQDKGNCREQHGPYDSEIAFAKLDVAKAPKQRLLDHACRQGDRQHHEFLFECLGKDIWHALSELGSAVANPENEQSETHGYDDNNGKVPARNGRKAHILKRFGFFPEGQLQRAEQRPFEQHDPEHEDEPVGYGGFPATLKHQPRTSEHVLEKGKADEDESEHPTRRSYSEGCR